MIGDPSLRAAADRFVELACLTYGGDDDVSRRDAARALRAATPSLTTISAHAAAAAGDVDALRVHLAHDASVVATPGTGRCWVPLLALCYSRVPQDDAIACLDVLLAHGARPDAHVAIGECSFTALTGVMGEGEAGPLMQPAHPAARAMAERLLDAGADPNDAQGLYNTHFLPSDAWLELLLARGLRAGDDCEFLLGQAAVQGFAGRVRRLLACGVRADGHNRYNHRTHLENAWLEGHADIARLLEAAGAPPPQWSATDRARVAILADDADGARALVAASSAARGDAGPLAAAARYGRRSALELGLSLGLPIDGRDHGGLTALHHAAQRGHLDCARSLVERGASTTIRDPRYGGTPLDHARHFAARWPHTVGDDLIALLAARTVSTAG